MTEPLTAVDLFSGLGVWASAAHSNSIRTLCFVEKDARCQSFLAKTYPGITIHDDINTFPAASYAGADIVWGGPPCQPASRAGQRKGASDDRWLWPQTLAAVAAIRPRCCLFENPPGIEDVGLDGILAALESQGYQIAPVFDIPACAVDSPQLRHRYYIVAFAKESRINGNYCDHSIQRKPRHENQQESYTANAGVGQADTAEPGQQRPNPKLEANGCGAQCVQGDLANSKSQRWQRRRQRSEQKEGGGQECPANGLHAEAWSNYVWLPCADGKFRRGPDDSFRLVDGLHRSIIAALGNGQIPKISQILARALRLALNQTPAL